MFSLFGTNTDEKTSAAESERFSRFETSDGEEALRKLGKLTRFDRQHRAQRDYQIPTEPVVPKRPERLIPAMNKQQTPEQPEQSDGFKDSAHLHEDGHIPLWVIRKALPGRFSQISAQEDDFALQ